ncbi:MAG TPA: nucleoside deaminase [Afifellaceae bacterium]|nr:nucleoside deaminase [Afifellaceae bacterium]
MPDRDISAAERANMMRAVNLSLEKMRSNEGGPFGAVITRNGEVISEGWNQVTSSNDPTAHAEVMAIRKACEKLGTFSLEGCEIYSSCEPCPMCLSAIYWARLDRLYFANSRDDAKAIGFDDAHIYEEVGKPVHERGIPTVHMHLPEAAAVFAEWHDKVDKIEY